jgi:hypothetical protein
LRPDVAAGRGKLSPMSRLWRALVLLSGGAVLVALVAHVGLGVVLGLLRQVGWSLLPVSALYALHVVVRAFALWRGLPDGLLPYADVLRVRVAGEAVEMLTFTGPWLAEPAKGWLLTRRGIGTAEAFGFIALEFLLYTLTAAWMAAAALIVMLRRSVLPSGFRTPTVILLYAIAVITLGFGLAVISGRGLVVPLLRRAGAATGLAIFKSLAALVAPGEGVLVAFLSGKRLRLLEVVAAEGVSHLLLAGEIVFVFHALGVLGRWDDALVFEGASKFIGAAFFFVPGQLGAQEGVYTVLASALGAPAAAGLTLALARRIRGVIVALAGLTLIRVSPQNELPLGQRG